MLLGERNNRPEFQRESGQGRPAWRAPLCTNPEPASGLERTERVRKSGREPRRSPGPILDGSGDGIPGANQLRPPQASVSGRMAVAPAGRKGRSRSSQRTERSGAWSHAIATMARCPKSTEGSAAACCSTVLVQPRTRRRYATGGIPLVIRSILILARRSTRPMRICQRPRWHWAINSECECTPRAS
jgi:hypothetical protein